MSCYVRAIPVLKALCDETRLRILSMIGENELTGCEINRAFCCTQPTISYHMKLLVDNGLVRARREGCQVFYKVNEDIWPSVSALLHTICASTKGENE